LDKLFTSVQRLDQEKNRNIEGTGLGITIVQRLLNMMDSELNVSSVYGAGSTFSFVVSQKIVNDETMGDFEQRFKASAEHTTDKAVRTAPGARVLVVDDNETNLLVAKNLLKRTLVKLETASSGSQCIELLRKNIYDIVFLDHMMPEPDGIETLHRIKEENLASGTQFIALTANAIHGAKQTYLDAGFDDYLSKPFTGSDIEKCLFKHISKDMIKSAEASTSPTINEQSNRSKLGSKLDIEKGLAECDNDRDMYLDAVYDFCTNNRCNDLELDFSVKDNKSYQANLKTAISSAEKVGLTELMSKGQKLLEALAGGDTQYAAAHHKAFIKMYRSAADNLEEAVSEYFSDTKK
ncbi:MAG: response regulator, partial [Oscillospiraceae bacterium]|nr:response regulator [Oscillospiraceae bacterium]